MQAGRRRGAARQLAQVIQCPEKPIMISKKMVPRTAESYRMGGIRTLRSTWVAGQGMAVRISAGEIDASGTLLDRLNLHILSSPTATSALEEWCRHFSIGQGPLQVQIVASSQAARGKRCTGYRRINLVRGDALLSVAEIRYSLRALGAEMLRALRETNIPFGEVVRALQPRRLTTLVWVGTKESGQDCGPVLIHHATVLDAIGRPIARVRENYQGSLISF